jgi:CRP-like cAMP-binding protein
MKHTPLNDPVLKPGHLRRLKVLSDLTDEQLTVFMGLIEIVSIKPNRIIVRSHECGDCMYLMLTGSVRVSQTIDQRETMLAVLEAGDFFGEMCLIDESVRSADVVAVSESQLLKISKDAFQDVIVSRPDIAARFLLAVMRVVSGRMRKMDKRFVDSMTMSRFWKSTTH